MRTSVIRLPDSTDMLIMTKTIERAIKLFSIIRL
ncbi:Uncharacterised protein [Fusobacterium necrophorum subsp. necrophorum]|nr:Uncharacterised protein [Fusobacterium necrophorum subsp. necrophorum]